MKILPNYLIYYKHSELRTSHPCPIDLGNKAKTVMSRTLGWMQINTILPRAKKIHRTTALTVIVQ